MHHSSPMHHTLSVVISTSDVCAPGHITHMRTSGLRQAVGDANGEVFAARHAGIEGGSKAILADAVILGDGVAAVTRSHLALDGTRVGRVCAHQRGGKRETYKPVNLMFNCRTFNSVCARLCKVRAQNASRETPELLALVTPGCVVTHTCCINELCAGSPTFLVTAHAIAV